MMKKYFNIALALVSGMFLFNACHYLEPDDKKNGNQTAESLFSSDPSVLRVYAYSLLQPIVSRVDVYEEGTDLYMPSNKKSSSDFDIYTFTPEDDKIKQFYADLYSCINMANACIHYDSDGKYTGEMRFLRAYCYYILTQQFGGVPYKTEYINDAGRSYPRESLSTIYSALIDELTLLSTDTTLPVSDSKGVASQRAAKALLAKVYLAAAWDLNQDAYFANAKNAADAAINGQELTMTFEDKWSPSNEANAEVIFAVQYERSGFPGDLKKGGHGLQNTFGSYYGDCAGTGEKYCNGMLASNPKSSYLWEATDQRYDGTFMTTMYNSPDKGWGTVGYYAYYNASADALSTMPVCMRVFPGTASEADVNAYTTAHAEQLQKGECVNEPVVLWMTYPNVKANGSTYDYYSYVNQNPGMFSAPVVKKFDDPASSNISVNMTNGYRDIVVLHLSDIYLVAAEAALKSGDKTGAEAYINKVRARAYGASHDVSFDTYKSPYAGLAAYPAYETTDIDLILDERARELYAEGHRWMDLRRTQQLVRYNNIFNRDLAGVAEGRVKQYRPIPQAEINANDAITDADQNPGY